MTKINRETLEYFLSEDFTNWLLTSLSNMQFSDSTQGKFYTFYTVINHYIELKDMILMVDLLMNIMKVN